MPYPKAQATAIFLRKKRQEGLAAAKAFGEKHREDFKGAKGDYRSRKVRASASGDRGTRSDRSDAAQRSGSRASRYNRRRRRLIFSLSEGNNQRPKRS